MVRREIEGIYPLSAVQEGLLFHTLYAPRSGVYFNQLSLALHGAIDVSALRRAWSEAIDRHSILRTAFAWEGRERPLQIVWKQVPLLWEQHDWRNCPERTQAQRLEEFLADDRSDGFDLTRAPLMRLALLQLDNERYQLVWSHHHLVLDGWSGPILLKEIFTLYESFRRGRPVRLPRPKPYADYIAWLKQYDDSAAREFWQKELAGFKTPTPLGIGRGRANSPDDTPTFADEFVLLSKSASDALQAFSRHLQVTLNVIAQGAWALLLSRYSGLNEVLFGIVSAGRPPSLPGVDSMVGLFIRTLPLRVVTPPEMPLNALLSDLQMRQAAALQYEYSSLIDIQGWSEVPRGNPLFDTLFVFENYPVDSTVREKGMDVGVRRVRVIERTNYPITTVVEPGPRLSVRITYDAGRFDRQSIAQMVERYATLLERFAADPDRCLGAISILTESDQDEIVRLNRTQLDFGNARRVTGLWREAVRNHPGSIAVSQGSQVLTFDELDRRSNQLARYLRELGVGPEAPVGICIERSIEMVIAVWGVLKSGGAYVPLDTLSPSDRLRFMVEDTWIKIILADSHHLDHIDGLGAHVIDLNADWIEIGSRNEQEPPDDISPENLAYLIYTSGSTGKPKAVGVTHGGLCNYLNWCVETYGLSSGGKAAAHTPLSFDLTVTSLLAPLVAGLQVELLDESLGVEALSQALRKGEEYALLKLTPAHLQALAEDFGQDEVPGWARTFVIGGEALYEHHLAWWRLRGRPFRPINEYGPTETVVGCSIYEAIDPTSVAAPIGRPIANVEIYILDRRWEVTPFGVVGELCIGGAGVARGYHGRPDLTAEKFIPHPYSERRGERLYRSGDLARYLPSGELEYLGRIDQQVKVRGYRIEPGEIEAAFLEHSSVKEAAVLSQSMNGDEQLIGYVSLKGDVSKDELRRRLSEKLPAYMVPAVIIILDRLPLNRNGKIERGALPAAHLEGSAGASLARPRTPNEEVLAEIWAEILNLPSIGIHESFFDLGGHSLTATRAVSRIRQAFRQEITLRTFFEHPTVHGLAAILERGLRGDALPEPPPLVKTASQEDILLSFAQERIWFLQQLQPESSAYNVATSVRWKGPLDIMAFEKSLSELCRRHHILRSRFPSEAGVARVVISGESDIEVPVVDLMSVPLILREREARRLTHEHNRHSFDLGKDRLLRVLVARLGPDEQALALVMHHIISDGWSMSIFVREFAAFYEAHRKGEPPVLSELPVQYADFARWQRMWLRGEALDSEVSYWKTQLASIGALELPTDRPRPAFQTFDGDFESFQLGPELASHLKKFARHEGATLFMALMSAFQILLHRYSGQNDVVVGTPVANRNRIEVENLIGFFVNMLVIRADCSGNPSFKQLLGRVRNALLNAYSRQDLPFEKLVESVAPLRSLSHNPIFQVAFVFQNTPFESLRSEDVTLEPLSSERATAKFDLTLALEESGGRIVGGIEYNRQIFDAATIRRMVGHFRTLIEGALKNPDRGIDELELLSEAERRQLLVGWNATATNYDAEPYLHQVFEAQAARVPDRVALTFEQESVTYQELNRRANQLAHLLRRLWVGPETRVGVCLERSCGLVLSIYAVLKAGGAYVPLDPEYPERRLAYQVADAQVGVIITERRWEQVLPQTGVRLLCLDEQWDEISRSADWTPDSRLYGENLAYVIYTSGSTGEPKGAMNTHAGILNRIQWMQQEYGLDHTDCVLQKTPYSFDVSVWEFLWPLTSGARLAVARSGGHRESRYLVELIEQEQVTTLHFVPAMLSAFLEEEGLESCRSVRRVICSGEELSRTLQERYWGRMEARLENLYGPTEASVDVTYWSCERGEERAAVPIGRPIANTEIYILDERLEPTPVGVSGEIYIGGVGLARGYVSRPELTAERFIAHPHSACAGRRVYKTGDAGRYRADGTIEFLGRRDRQVKVRGFRIELGEVEAALGEQEGVRQAIVEVKEGAAGQKQLVAYLALKEEASVRDVELREKLREKLPEYMVPSVWVRVEEFPLTGSGKVDRGKLPGPGQWRQVEEEAYEGPRTREEEELAKIWTEVLRVERVGVYDNFFALGGDSILSIQVVARAQQAGLRLSPRQMFEHQTVAELAAVVEPVLWREQVESTENRSESLPFDGITQEEFDAVIAQSPEIEDAYPLSPMQEGMLYHTLYAPDSGLYTVQWSCLLQNLDIDAFAGAWRQLIERHEILRTAFLWKGIERPIQVVHSKTPLRLEKIDWRMLEPEMRQTELKRYLEEDSIRGFDLASAPLMRLVLAQLDVTTFRLIWSHHHLLLDGWSTMQLIDEVFALYDGNRQGAKPLVRKRAPYRDYIAWINRQNKSEVESYWRGLLKGFSEHTPLPFTTDQRKTEQPQFAERSLQLTEQLSERLVAFARSNQLTLNTLFQGIWGLLLGVRGNRRDVVFGATVSGRPAGLPGVESMTGLFINTIPVRVCISSDEPIVKWLHELQTQQSEARQYDYAPLNQVRKWSDVPPGTALFESLLVFENFPIAFQDAGRENRPTVQEVRSFGRINYPLVFTIVPGAAIRLRLDFDCARLERGMINRLALEITTLLEYLSNTIDLPRLSVHSLLKVLTDTDGEHRLQEEREVDNHDLPNSGSDRQGSDGLFSFPRTRAEEILAEIWRKVLRLEHIGLHDNFFALGGDSILSIRVASKALAKGLNITVKQIAENPTIEQLAAVAQRLEENVSVRPEFQPISIDEARLDELMAEVNFEED